MQVKKKAVKRYQTKIVTNKTAKKQFFQKIRITVT